MFPRGWVTGIELCELSSLLRGLDGETRMVMEATRSYHLPMAKSLYDSGFYVSVVNAILVHGYGNNSLWRAKTDKKDALRLANYASTIGWPRYIPEDEAQLQLQPGQSTGHLCFRLWALQRHAQDRYYQTHGGAGNVSAPGRFHSKKVLVAFSWIDAPLYQSGHMEVRSRSISKRGSSALRRTPFLVISH